MAWGPDPVTQGTMRAVVMESFGPPDGLAVREVPKPPLMPHNEVLIEVHAAGVNPFETKIRRGWFQGMFPVAPPHVLGTDVAGVIVAKGFDVSEFEVGDRVWGLLDPAKPGAYAEYVAAPSYLVRRMPANLSFEEAAAIPMAGCTAWFGLVDLAGVGPGKRVLVHGGAGGVGSMGVQIAKARGAWVATTTSTRNLDYVRELGADEVIDYTAGDFAAGLSDIDVVLDPIGGETNLRSYPVMQRGGTMLVVLRGDQVEMANRDRLQAEHGVTTKVVAFSAQPEILDRMRTLFEGGQLRAPLETVLPMERAGEAHAMSETGRTRGKIVLKVRP
jgi:NADPH:quinone reductase-like Zn-dependent oxidoreductase